MLDIILTLVREIAKSKKLLFFLFMMIVTTGYSYGKKLYLNYYKKEVTMAKFIAVNCDSSLRFENEIFKIDINIDHFGKTKPHCIFNRQAWQEYEKVVVQWVSQSNGIDKYIYNIQINDKKNFIIFITKYGDVYEAFKPENTLSKFIKNNYYY
ncbi:MAG: hypothetical protein RL208_246 [Pseudomonadota bacterium]|jgi:hypothetical protein